MALASFEGCKANNTQISNGDKSLEGRLTSSVGQYDYGNSMVRSEHVNMMTNCVAKFNQKTKFNLEAYIGNNKVEDKPGISRGWGSGIVLKYGERFYMLTANHVVEKMKDRTINAQIGTTNLKLKFNIKENKSYVQLNQYGFKCKTIADDTANDLSLLLLDVPKGVEVPYFNGKIGEYDKIGRANITYVVGYPGEFGKIITQGIISGESNNYIISSAPINPGNSGGPMYLLEKGNPVLIGITSVTWKNEQLINGFIGVDKIRDLLKRAGLGENG